MDTGFESLQGQAVSRHDDSQADSRPLNCRCKLGFGQTIDVITYLKYLHNIHIQIYINTL